MTNLNQVGYMHEHAIRDMNANSHPMARIAYHALDNVFQKRQQKWKQQATPVAKAQKPTPAPQFKPTV